MTIRPLTSLGTKALPKGAALKVCVVSLIGAARNGGIGTATDAMVRHIARDGHDVTLLYSMVEYGVPVNVAQAGNPSGGLRDWKGWTDDLARDGVRLEKLDHQGSHSAWLEKSWRVKEFIGSRDFDVVYFDEWQGTGYYAQLAKRAGLLPFARQVQCVFTHASKQWVCETNDEYLRQVSDVTVLGMERRSVEMADVVLSPSRYLLEEYARYGWALPESSFHHPLPLLKAPVPADPRRRPVDEIVFFGRLETRKGLWLFCDALDRLGDRLRGKTVTFLGPLTAPHGTSTGTELLQRSANWRFKLRMITDLGSRDAQRYLTEGRRLAVMPSLDDNSPCVIYECMEAGIPFVTTSSGGGGELIDKASWPDAIVEPSAEALAERLGAILRDGARPATPSFDPVEALADWTGWLRLVARDPASVRRAPPADAPVTPATPPLLVVMDDGRCPVPVIVGTLASLTRRFGSRARCLVLSGRRGLALEAVRQMLSGIVGPDVACFGPEDDATARKTIADADVAFFMDADTEFLTPFFILALGVLTGPRPVLATCLGASRSDGPGSDPQIEVLPAGDVPGLAALGHILTGPVWAIAPKRVDGVMDGLDFRDDRHDRLFSAWTLGETMARKLGPASLALIPVVGAITPPADRARPLITADRLRRGAGQLGLGSSLHAGGASWFGITTFGARSDLPAGAIGLHRGGALDDGPLADRLAAAESDGDLARAAALCGRPGLALQIEAERASSTARVQELIGLAAEALRQRPVIDLVPLLSKAIAVSPVERLEAAEAAGGAAVFRDPRLTCTGERLRSTETTRAGGPARLGVFDVEVGGQTRLNLRLRSLLPQPLLLRTRIVDQDCGEVIEEASLRIALREPADVQIDLPGIFGRLAILLDFSGAERLDLAIEALELR